MWKTMRTVTNDAKVSKERIKDNNNILLTNSSSSVLKVESCK